MTIIDRRSLQFQYVWSAIPPDDARVTGKPDATFLNRNEGYEVLAFLNRTCQDLGMALKAERLIKGHLPGTIRSRANVLDWLQRNWSFFK